MQSLLHSLLIQIYNCWIWSFSFCIFAYYYSTFYCWDECFNLLRLESSYCALKGYSAFYFSFCSYDHLTPLSSQFFLFVLLFLYPSPIRKRWCTWNKSNPWMMRWMHIRLGILFLLHLDCSVRCCWVITIKCCLDGIIDKYKARLVARDFTQT